MIGSGHHHHAFGGDARSHGLFHDPPHMGLADAHLGVFAARVPVFGLLPQAELFAVGRSAQPVALTIGGVLQHALPEEIMRLTLVPAVRRVPFPGSHLRIAFGFFLDAVTRRKGQKDIGRQIHEATGHAMLPRPEYGLIFRGIFRQRIEQGANGRLARIGQYGYGRLGAGPDNVRQQGLQIGGGLNQHDLRAHVIQQPPQMKGARRGQMAHPEENRFPAHGSSSRQAE